MADTKTATATEKRLSEAQAFLQEGKLLQCASSAEALLDEDSENTDALYLLAVCQRYLKQYDKALGTLARLKRLRPAYGRAYQEEGHVYLASKSKPDAKNAFRHAVSLNRSLLASWQGLQDLLTEAGEQDQAAEARDQANRLAALPPELLSVRNMTAEGQYLKAEQLCRFYLKANPKHVEGMRLLADLGIKSGVLDDAEFLLESAVEFEPDNRFARYDYVGVLYRRQKYQEALKQAAWLKDKYPDNLDYQVAFANQCVAVGDYASALPIFEDSILKRPARSDLHLVYGHALKTIGKVDEAIAAYRNVYQARPDFGDAFWSLANLKTYRFTEAEVDRMLSAEDSVRTVLDDRAHLCFALGKHYEDSEHFERSVVFYERGNALRRAQLRYDADDMTRRLALQKTEVSANTLQTRTGYEDPAPIFIVGLPRAGSTLLEQILASHSQVDGTLELPNIPSLAFRLGGRQRADQAPRYPAILNELDAAKLKKFGEDFINDTQVHRQGAACFIDKMPNNFRHIGLIQKILPNAKIIDARRHPMACCFSGYKQLFASGQEFTYGLKEIGQYYRDYVELMDHWDALMPDRILRVYYEDVVADLETQVRRILDYCGLAFEPACLEFHKTDRSVRTPSAEQVRQPIYSSGLAQWQHYEPWLGPLKTALGDVLDQYPR